jgi:uncharacterized protein YbbC (DUF1343 family)
MIRAIAVALLGSMVIAMATSAPATVREQLDELITRTAGKRLGIITNPSGCDEQGDWDLHVLLRSPDTTVTALFATEHGLFGKLAAGAPDGDYVDPETSIPVYALYGPRLAPTDEQLRTVDALVYDMQDVGVRFYTRVWSMTHCMEAAARHGKPFYVIDRPNPLGGLRVEGAVNREDYGLVGRLAPGARFCIATRHGMTVGEIATMWNEEYVTPKAQLHVIRMRNWKREQFWRDTGRVFVPPSPNMRTPEAAVAYPGTCIFEGSNLSEGRGTEAPFLIVGAPFVGARAYADALTSLSLPGVQFQPLTFVPESSKWKGETCGGVRLTVTDPDRFEPVRTGMHMLQVAKRLYPAMTQITPYASRLMAIPGLHETLETSDVDEILRREEELLSDFLQLRAKHLLY